MNQNDDDEDDFSQMKSDGESVIINNDTFTILDSMLTVPDSSTSHCFLFFCHKTKYLM